jgi:hypothetical protein
VWGLLVAVAGFELVPRVASSHTSCTNTEQLSVADYSFCIVLAEAIYMFVWCPLKHSR